MPEETTDRRSAAGLPHILVVDDNPLVRDSMVMVLEFEGYRVSTASSAAEALDRTRANPDIAIVFVDLHLGAGERGTDVIRSIRTILGQSVKAVLISGDTSTAGIIMAQESDLLLVRKPVKYDALIEILHRLKDAHDPA